MWWLTIQNFKNRFFSIFPKSFQNMFRYRISVQNRPTVPQISISGHMMTFRPLGTKLNFSRFWAKMAIFCISILSKVTVDVSFGWKWPKTWFIHQDTSFESQRHLWIPRMSLFDAYTMIYENLKIMILGAFSCSISLKKTFPNFDLTLRIDAGWVQKYHVVSLKKSVRVGLKHGR